MDKTVMNAARKVEPEKRIQTRRSESRGMERKEILTAEIGRASCRERVS